jgi:hypothetical protein
MKFDTVELEKMVDETPASEQTKSFVDQVEADNEVLFSASEKQIEAYYKSITDKQALTKHFTGRMVNERMNMVELANKVANAPADMDPKELQLLSKQALDEANHFRMVKDVVEYMNGGPIDVKAAVEYELANRMEIKGAKLIAKYDCENDEIAMALYQLIAEGRAARNWAMLSSCVSDPFVSNTYAKIARDEGFHANIGGMKLAQLVTTAEQQAAVEALVGKMRKDLFDISCKNTQEVAAAKELVEEAYGW